MKEHWVKVRENPDYEVSNTGRVRKVATGKMMRQSFNQDGGYLRVSIGGQKRYVHRLVASSFFEEDGTDKDVNHIDGDRTNNSLSNLEWCTRKENLQHASRNDLYHVKVKRVVTCKHCKHRYEFDQCVDKPDDFFCAYGEH